MPLRDVITAGDGGDPRECWEWPHGRYRAGYGSVVYGGRNGYTHRLSYDAHRGPIPEGMHIDHLCRNRACWNPAHLEPVTLAENNRRAAAAITECPAGHPYTHENLRPGRGRDCRICHREQERGRRRTPR